MLHLTYTEMWEAWLNMRGDTVVPGLVKETHSKYVNVGAGSHARVRERYPYHTSAGQGSPHKRKEKDSGRQDRYDKKDMGRNDEQARGSDEIRKPKLRPYPWARQEHVEKPAPQPKPREEEDKGNKVEKKPKPKKKVRWGMVTEIPPSPVKW